MPKEFIKIDQRGYKFIREATIKSLDDALVELITNSDDAYDKGKIIQKKIEIELDYKLKTLKVRDFAIGLFAEEMNKCFLQAGKFTSDKASRGFFSRGAKDITALGDVTFESVKKRKFSRVILDKDARGMLEVADSKATRKIRKKNLGIPNGNGLLVSINIKDSFELPTPHYLCNIFIHHISLRNILSNIDNNITLKVLNYKDEKYNKIHQLKYENPNGELLMYFTYKIKYYPDAEAFFALYESKDKLYNNGNKKYNDWGILISSQKVIHDNTTFNSKNTFNPNMKKLFGIIHCDYLNQLLHDYDKNGSTKRNPFPILDPSRVGGINFKHPFMKRLNKIPIDRLRLVLESFDQNEENNIEIGDLSDLVGKLNLSIDTFIKSKEVLEFVPDKNSKLIKAIESDRGKWINVEKNYLEDLLTTGQKSGTGTKTIRKFKDSLSDLFKINLSHLNKGNVDPGKLMKILDEKTEKETEKKKVFIFDRLKSGKSSKRMKTAQMESTNYSHLKKKKCFDLKFCKMHEDDPKYEIYNNGSKIILKVNINNKNLKRYFGDENIDIKTLKIESLMQLRDLLTEGLTKVLLLTNINKDQLQINSQNSIDNYTMLFKKYDDNKKLVEDLVDNVINKVIDEEKENIIKKIKGT